MDAGWIRGVGRSARMATAGLMLSALTGLIGCGHPASPEDGFAGQWVELDEQAALQRIAFGSCVRQDRAQPVWDAVLAADPDLFILLGDNIYADTRDMDVMRRKYAELAANPGFARLRATTPILATWDDHDYGLNDAGADYAMRAASQQVFCDFFGVPADSPRRTTPGIYDSVTVGPDGRRVQIILLDTRYFRGPLTRADPRPAGRGPYTPQTDESVTLLGEAQWAWLERQLRQPADLRLIASSIQFVADRHGWECWGQFPHERRRMIDLIDRTGAERVVFLSGDRHSAELSRLETERTPYPLYDATGSALNQPRRPQDEPNPYRIGEVIWGPNFGLLRIDWSGEPAVRFELRNVDGEPIVAHTAPLAALER